MLEDDAHALSQTAQRFPVEMGCMSWSSTTMRPRGGAFQQVHEAQEAALPGTRSTDDAEYLALAHGEVDAAERGEVAAPRVR